MSRKFSENSRRLLRNSLTVEMRDFAGKIADAGAPQRATGARFNPAFTMTGVHGAWSLWFSVLRLALV
jgi:hypothetical protein